MRLTPQDYIESTYAGALAAECNIVQPRYVGQWCRISVRYGIGFVYSATGESLWDFETKTPVCATLIGTFMGPPRWTQTIIAWDCWRISEEHPESLRLVDTNLEHFSYRDRFAFLKQQTKQLEGLPIRLIENHPILMANDLWERNDEPLWSGLVYRCSRDPVGVSLRVARKYPEMPGGLP